MPPTSPAAAAPAPRAGSQEPTAAGLREPGAHRSPPLIRAAVTALALATAAIAAAYASAFGDGGAPRWAAWAMAVGVPLALVAVMTLGAARAGRLPPSLFAAFVLVGAMLVAGFALALLLPGGASAVGEPLLLGLPRRAAIVVYGIGLLPTVVLPVAYALTFEAQTLRPEDLEKVLEMGRARVRNEERGTTSPSARASFLVPHSDSEGAQ